MKGVISWSIFAAFYILIILLLQVSAQNPFSGLFGGPPAQQQHPVMTTQPGMNAANEPQQQSQNNSSGNFLSSLPATLNLGEWGITDPSIQQSINSMYGTIVGRPDCVMRSICVFGNYLHDMPGRDVLFMLISRWVPQEWSLAYDVFRISIMYGQDCSRYSCTSPGVSGPAGVQVPGPGSGFESIPSAGIAPAPGVSPAPTFDNTIQKSTYNSNINNPSQQRFL